MPVPSQIRRQVKPIAFREKDGMKIWAYNKNGKPICNARRNSQEGKGSRCQSTLVVAPSGRCKKHGGHTRHGVSHQSFKTGKYSQYIPKSIREQFQEFLADENYLSLRENIAVSETRLSQLLAGIEDVLDAVTIKSLQKIARNMEIAMEQGDALEELKILRTQAHLVIRIADLGKNNTAHWREVEKTQDHLRSLIETEQKRLEKMSRQMTAEDAWLLITKVIFAIKEVVDDGNQLMKLANMIDRIMAESRLPSNFSYSVATEQKALPANVTVQEKFPDYENEEE